LRSIFNLYSIIKFNIYITAFLIQQLGAQKEQGKTGLIFDYIPFLFAEYLSFVVFRIYLSAVCAKSGRMHCCQHRDLKRSIFSQSFCVSPAINQKLQFYRADIYTFHIICIFSGGPLEKRVLALTAAMHMASLSLRLNK